MNEQISKVIHHSLFVPITVGAASFAAGVGAGYFLALRKKQGTHELPEQLTLDLEATMTEIREDIQSMKRPNVEPIIIDAEVFEAKVKDIPEEEVEVLVETSVFAHNDEDWDYEEEVKNRTVDNPYILHKDEFYEDEKNYTQTTLTYYSGDNIMADQEDAPVYNHETLVGPMRFGHGSGDPNVFYVRNDKRRAEYEILYDPGLFSEEVLGLEIENNARVQDLKHSQVRRFRPD